MIIPILADSHFGARQDSLIFNSYFIKFYNDIFFPWIDNNNIRTMFHLGDVFDRRKYVNYHILDLAKKYFFDKLRDRHIDLHILLGNHGIFYKNHSEVNSSQLLEGYDNITYYNSPKEIELDGLKMGMVPWINDANSKESHKFIEDSTVKYLFGHFEIKGCELSPGIKQHDGLNMKIFKKFNKVISGHFHHRSLYGNIQYVGAPYQITYTDLKDGKGFCTFDTDNGNLKFYKNPYEMFYSLDYDDTIYCYDKIEQEDFDMIDGCYVKIIIINKTNPYLYDRFFDAVEAANPARISVIENINDYDVTESDILELKEDTITVINREIDELLIAVDKNKLKSIVKQLYVESLDN